VIFGFRIKKQKRLKWKINAAYLNKGRKEGRRGEERKGQERARKIT